MAKLTLILGNGACARSIAEGLSAEGVEIIVASTGGISDPSFAPISKDKAEGSVELLTKTRLLTCSGAIGSFIISMERDGENITRSVAHVIIAEEDVREQNVSLYGLSPSPRVLSLSRIVQPLSEITDKEYIFSKVKKAVFLTGLVKESNPVIMEEVMRSCLDMQSNFKVQTYIVTQNLKVAGNGLEALYRKTREAGVVYIKLTDNMPEIRQDDDGSVSMEFRDEITLEEFRLAPDIVIVDETISPSDYLRDLAVIFGIDRDQAGFVQADNVHRLSVFTNRKGIMVAGPARGIQSPADQIIDAGNAVISAIGLIEGRVTALEDMAEIDQGRCIHCLTCYRLCPYRAIILDPRVTILSDACEGCGICAAECPRGAVKTNNPAGSEIPTRITEYNKSRKREAFVPLLVAFCCRRSASMAGELASCLGHKLPQGLMVIEVPCAGSISIEHILIAFKNNADGVLVLTCHEGNCHSERGNIYAHRRAGHIAGFLPNIGLEEERLVVETLASNMAVEFTEITNNFEKKILKLGPTPLALHLSQRPGLRISI